MYKKCMYKKKYAVRSLLYIWAIIGESFKLTLSVREGQIFIVFLLIGVI